MNRYKDEYIDRDSGTNILENCVRSQEKNSVIIMLTAAKAIDNFNKSARYTLPHECWSATKTVSSK